MPLRPYKTKVSSVNSTTILVEWEKQVDATITHFRIYLSEGADNYVKQPTEPDANTTSIQISNLKPATKYFVYVVSVDNSNVESDVWTAKSCTTPPDSSDIYLTSVKQIAENTKVELEQPIEQCDVLVIGAGYAGLSAAYGAGLEGKKVILLERSHHVGGVGINGGVCTYMYTNSYAYPYQVWYDKYSQFTHYLNNTWGGAIWGDKGLKKTLAESGGNYEPPFAEVAWLEMLREAGVSLRLGQHGSQAIIEKKSGERDKMVGVLVENEFGGRYAIKAKVVIDCTYHLNIAYDAGAEYCYGRESKTQRLIRKKGYADTTEAHTESLLINNVEQVPDTPDDITQGYSSHLFFKKAGTAVTAKKPSSGFNYTTESELPQGGWGGYQYLTPDELMQNVLRVVGDTRNEGAMQYAFQKHWKQSMGYQYYVNANQTQNFVFSHMPSMLGIRESRRIVGDYVLTANHLEAGTFTNDSIARANYIIDVHKGDGSAGTSTKTVPSYGIPYRCIYSRNVDNLLCPSGRNLSGSHLAIASSRVQIQVMATGFAGGLAASQAIDSNKLVSDINITTLRNKITTYGQPVS